MVLDDGPRGNHTIATSLLGGRRRGLLLDDDTTAIVVGIEDEEPIQHGTDGRLRLWSAVVEKDHLSLSGNAHYVFGG